MPSGSSPIQSDPLWYKDGIIYELHVKAFYDSNDDGIGDFRGLMQKLDYLQDLGVTAIWLLPFCPSPLRDDGYDISDYTSVHPMYGSLGDFRAFLREAHRRGLKVITELVLNHTSDQHPWFQRARRAKPGSRWRQFYVWSDTPDRYQDARVIFQDFESSNWAWDPVAKAYYWHRFYSHQPDLNYDNPAVQKAIFRVLDFWLDMGVDGLRLDAVPYLFEREGTNCENLPETFHFLRTLRAHLDAKYDARMLLAEANQWPEDAVRYFGEGDICHMAYHFPLMPRLFMALRMEDRFPVIDIMDQTPPIPENCQWALFLRNHDELTLEMVTDEERDYMYRVYAQDPQMRLNLGIRRRLAPLLGNHRRRIELLNGLLFSLPGTPIIYYGDEIGMGDNFYLGDRNGVRTPMQWSPDRNAGFSRANPQQLYLPVIIDPEYHYEAVNVEAQQRNTHSLLWWMKRLITLRRRSMALGRGSMEILYPQNRKILAFIRHYGEERILVVANLSRFAQHVELDLSPFAGTIPVEVFGKTEFPPIGEAPYVLTLGPHSFFWFSLMSPWEQRQAIHISPRDGALPHIAVSGRWQGVLAGKERGALEGVLPGFLKGCRWFGGKARSIKRTRISEAIPLIRDASMAYIVFVEVEYLEGDPETYCLVLGLAQGDKGRSVLQQDPERVIARVIAQEGKQEGVLYEAMSDPDVCRRLLASLAKRRHHKGLVGTMVCARTRAPGLPSPEAVEAVKPTLLRGEQSNTSVIYEDRWILKFFRRLQPGINPDLEIGRFLTERRFPHVPPVLGYMEYRRFRQEPATLAILQGLVPNQGDAWSYTVDMVAHYLDESMARGFHAEASLLPKRPLMQLAVEEIPGEARDRIGPYIEAVILLGRRTAQMHLALASDPRDPAFRPEPFTRLYQRSLYQSIRGQAKKVLRLLRDRLGDVPKKDRDTALRVLEGEKDVLDRLGLLLQEGIKAHRIRCHGDYHLGQVLFTGKDFVIIDFEGEPARPVTERRMKRSPLRDVAGMLRSFHYAAYSAWLSQGQNGWTKPEQVHSILFSLEFWVCWVSVAFLREYLNIARQGGFLPDSPQAIQVLLDAYLMEKALYEISYELNNRPEWIRIPLEGMIHLLDLNPKTE